MRPHEAGVVVGAVVDVLVVDSVVDVVLGGTVISLHGPCAQNMRAGSGSPGTVPPGTQRPGRPNIILYCAKFSGVDTGTQKP